MKVLVFGDIGGHHDLFKEALWNAGCGLENPNKGMIPDDTWIVQVGDLVDRGPDSDGVIRLVDRFIRHPRWVQLIGNHEAQYLGGPGFMTPNSGSSPSERSIEMLRTWHKAGLMNVAAGVTVQSRPTLITHAGLPFSFWNRLNQPNCETTVSMLNEMGRTSPATVFAAGEMLGEPSTGIVGPVWASGWNELIVPWYTAMVSEYLQEMPFDMIHGHCTLFRWGSQEWSQTFTGHPFLRHRMWANSVKRHSSFHAEGVNIMQCDPGLGKFASFVPVPVALQAERVYV